MRKIILSSTNKINNQKWQQKMTTRKAILIGAPSVKPVLPGVKSDIESMKNFLLSNTGGAWRDDEVITLVDAKPELIKQEIASAKNCDYVFILCSGHGEHHVKTDIDETVIYLTETDFLSITNINPKNKRHLVIVDVCRNESILLDSTETLLKATLESYSSVDTYDYRSKFDAAIMKSSEGRIVAYSCGINQSAGENSAGGYFTQGLINSPKKFRPTAENNHGIVNISQAFDSAQKSTYDKNAPQNPVFNAGRRRDFFPFAIVKK